MCCEVDTCCCCIDLRSGVKALGGIGVIACIIGSTNVFCLICFNLFHLQKKFWIGMHFTNYTGNSMSKEACHLGCSVTQTLMF